MMRLSVEKKNGFVILVFDDSYQPRSEDEAIETLKEFAENLLNYTKSSEVVIFKIDDFDVDGRWSDFAQEWLRHKKSIHFVCPNESNRTIIANLFEGIQGTIHTTIDEAVKFIKSQSV